MEKIWQHTHFLIGICYNNISNIHELRYAENASQKIGNVTHKLLVKVKEMMRLPSTKCTIHVTHKLLVIGKYVLMRWHFTKCHYSQPVGHRKDVMRLFFTNCTMSLTPCWL